MKVQQACAEAYRLLLVAFSICSSRAVLAEEDHQLIIVGTVVRSWTAINSALGGVRDGCARISVSGIERDCGATVLMRIASLWRRGLEVGRLVEVKVWRGRVTGREPLGTRR